MNKSIRSINFVVYSCAAVFFLVCTIPKLSFAADTGLWDSLRSGEYIAIMRHALAPGTGDPAEFTLSDCNTQRNLSDKGREQAKRIGERFRKNGIQAADVFSSQWCRCLDTATLLELGPVQELPIINSFFRNFEQREPQTQALRQWIASQAFDVPLVLITHQVNITALTGVYPSSGEMVVIELSDDGEIKVVGTMTTD